MENKTILVTGGAGFIGSNFIRYQLLNNPHYKIVNFDKFTYAGNPNNLRDFEKNPNYKLVRGDITNQDNVKSTIEKENPDCIINFAAESHVDNSIKDPVVFAKTNILGTNILLEFAKKNNIEQFIQVSTDEVYGSTKTGKFKETDKLKPNSPYSASKAAADLLVRSFIKTYNFPAIIVRPSNNFGPYQYTEKFIPLSITNLMQEKKIPLYGNGKNVREWIYVEDTCSAIDKILHRGVIGETYNIGSGETKSNIDVAKTLQSKLQKGKDMIEFIEDRKGHDFRYFLDSNKTRRLKWKPTYTFEEGLLKTITWYKENKWWWENNN
jgi:dTDP-glucose 4,6-dehydratase